MLNASAPLTAHESRRAEDRSAVDAQVVRERVWSTMIDRVERGEGRRKEENWGEEGNRREEKGRVVVDG